MPSSILLPDLLGQVHQHVDHPLAVQRLAIDVPLVGIGGVIDYVVGDAVHSFDALQPVDGGLFLARADRDHRLYPRRVQERVAHVVAVQLQQPSQRAPELRGLGVLGDEVVVAASIVDAAPPDGARTQVSGLAADSCGSKVS